MLSDVEEWPDADYRYRVIVSRFIAMEIIRAMVEEIDYSNFKSKIAKMSDQRVKLPAYNKIWQTIA